MGLFDFNSTLWFSFLTAHRRVDIVFSLSFVVEEKVVIQSYKFQLDLGDVYHAKNVSLALVAVCPLSMAGVCVGSVEITVFVRKDFGNEPVAFLDHPITRLRNCGLTTTYKCPECGVHFGLTDEEWELMHVRAHVFLKEQGVASDWF